MVDASAVDPSLLRFTTRQRLVGVARGTGGDPAGHAGVRALAHGAAPDGGRARRSPFCPCHIHPAWSSTGARLVIHVASTRNPNIVFDLEPVVSPSAYGTGATVTTPDLLVPVRSRYLPGAPLLARPRPHWRRPARQCRRPERRRAARTPTGGYEPVWWPRCVESPDGPRFDRNYLQLNSIAAGRRPGVAPSSRPRPTAPSARRPGHRNFPVDGRGVIFSGSTSRADRARLTRPHSARLHARPHLGRATAATARSGVIERRPLRRRGPPARLDARARASAGEVAFVGTSRVIPRFRHYAPGLDVDASVCGIHAVDTRVGRGTRAACIWP